MFITGPALLAREIIDFGKEQLRHLGGEYAVIVLGEDAVIEAAVAELAIQKPEPEQIVAELVTEEPFTAHTVQRTEHPGLQQLLRRNAIAASVGIEFVKQGREFLQHRIHAALDGAQWVIRRHAGIEVDDGQEVGLSLRFSTHATLEPQIATAFKQKAIFNKLLDKLIAALSRATAAANLSKY